MYQLTKLGRRVADALDKDSQKEYLLSLIADWDLSQPQQTCLNWLRGNLGPKLMDRAIEAKVVNPLIPKALKQLVNKKLVEEVN